MRLADKVAIITGAASGIGRASAVMFAKEGAKVVVADVDDAGGEETVAIIGSSGGVAIFVHTDVSAASEVNNLIRKSIDEFGKIDVLFNNAGIVLGGIEVENNDESSWERTFAINAKSVFLAAKYAIPHMKKAGSGVIINNASDWGLVGGRGAVAYCTSKGAVIQMTRAMALDHALENIRINAVCPGDTYVKRWSEEGYYQGSGAVGAEIAREESGKTIPMGRVGEAEEIANAVLFLASDAAAYITGTTLVVDGGNTAK